MGYSRSKVHPLYGGQTEKVEDFLEFQQLFLLFKPGIPSKGIEGKLTNLKIFWNSFIIPITGIEGTLKNSISSGIPPSFSALRPGILGTGKHEQIWNFGVLYTGGAICFWNSPMSFL